MFMAKASSTAQMIFLVVQMLQVELKVGLQARGEAPTRQSAPA
jgi:hypothetical protein